MKVSNNSLVLKAINNYNVSEVKQTNRLLYCTVNLGSTVGLSDVCDLVSRLID